MQCRVDIAWLGHQVIAGLLPSRDEALGFGHGNLERVDQYQSLSHRPPLSLYRYPAGRTPRGPLRAVGPDLLPPVAVRRTRYGDGKPAGGIVS